MYWTPQEIEKKRSIPQRTTPDEWVWTAWDLDVVVWKRQPEADSKLYDVLCDR